MVDTGRPTKYSEEFIGKVDEYLASRQDDEYEVGDRGFTKIRVKLPTIEGFAVYIGVNKTTLYEWDKKYPEFSNSLDKIKQEQQERLLDNGLAGTYNSTIAKLILSSNHGMREKSDVTTDGKELPTPLLANMDSNVLNNDSNKEDSSLKEEN